MNHSQQDISDGLLTGNKTMFDGAWTTCRKGILGLYNGTPSKELMERPATLSAGRNNPKGSHAPLDAWRNPPRRTDS